MAVTTEQENKASGYKQTEVGVIPKDWSAPFLGELFTFKNGLNKAKEFFGHGTPIVNYMDVYGKRGLYARDLKGRVSVSKQEMKTFEVRKGDVFFTRTSETAEEVGITSVILDDPKDTVFSGFILRARPKDESIDNQFKKYCFSIRAVRKQITSQSTETTRALTNGRYLSAVAIPLPPQPEQRAIAAALSDVDTLIKDQDVLIAKKRELKQGAMQQLITGKRRLPGFSGEWQVRRLGDVGVFRGGNGFPLRYQGNEEGKYPFFKVSDMNNEGNESFMANSNNWISEDVREQIGATIFPRHSVVFAKIGAAIFLERKKLLLQDSCIDNNMMGFIPSQGLVHHAFVHYLFLSLHFGRYVSTTALPSLSGKELAKLELRLPLINEQAAITAVLSDMDDEIAALERRREKIHALKQAMMQELLTGKTRLI